MNEEDVVRCVFLSILAFAFATILFGGRPMENSETPQRAMVENSSNDDVDSELAALMVMFF